VDVNTDESNGIEKAKAKPYSSQAYLWWKEPQSPQAAYRSDQCTQRKLQETPGTNHDPNEKK
jgi:hypothetical protein